MSIKINMNEKDIGPKADPLSTPNLQGCKSKLEVLGS